MPPQAGEPAPQIEAAVTEDAAAGVQPALHRRQPDDRLERRPRREGAAQRLVGQRSTLIVGQGAIDLGRDARHEQVGIERGRRHHGQDIAVANVHDDDAARLLAEHLQRALLDVVVQRKHHLGPLNRWTRSGDVLGHDAAARIDLDPLAAFDAAQILIQRLFNALSADTETGVEQDGRRLFALVADRLHVAVRHLGHIAHHMGVGAAVRIVAGLVHVSHDAGQFSRVQIDLGELLPGQVALDRDRRETRRGVDVADDGATALQGVRQQLTQQVQRLVQILGLVANDQDAEAGPVPGDDHAVAVLDQAARRRHLAEVELVARRQGGELFRLEELQMRQASDQGQPAHDRRPAQQHGAPQEGALPLVHVGKEDMRFAAHRNRTSASSKRSINQSASGKSRSVGIICPITASRLGAFPRLPRVTK